MFQQHKEIQFLSYKHASISCFPNLPNTHKPYYLPHISPFFTTILQALKLKEVAPTIIMQCRMQTLPIQTPHPYLVGKITFKKQMFCRFLSYLTPNAKQVLRLGTTPLEAKLTKVGTRSRDNFHAKVCTLEGTNFSHSRLKIGPTEYLYNYAASCSLILPTIPHLDPPAIPTHPLKLVLK